MKERKRMTLEQREERLGRRALIRLPDLEGLRATEQRKAGGMDGSNWTSATLWLEREGLIKKSKLEGAAFTWVVI